VVLVLSLEVTLKPELSQSCRKNLAEISIARPDLALSVPLIYALIVPLGLAFKGSHPLTLHFSL